MITVLTPTYNRSPTLTRLFNSLNEQTNKNFEWLIVDDGSTDNTKDLIQKFEEKADFPVKYLFKENGGKHTALNMGFDAINKKNWIYLVDSDDWLPHDVIEFAINEIRYLSDEYVSISMLKAHGDGNVVGGLFPKGLNSYIERQIQGVKGDKADVIRADVLSEFQFPEYDGERFMAESPLFLYLSKAGKTNFVNNIAYYCEYLDDGLSRQSVSNRYDNINGTLFVYQNQYQVYSNTQLKIKAAINWWRFRCGKKTVESGFRPSYIFLPFGMALYAKDCFLRYKKNLCD